MKKNIKNTLLLITSLLILSCSDKLDRDKASEIIIKHYEYPNTETVTIPTYIKYSKLFSDLQKDIADSLLTQEISGRGFGVYGIMQATVHLELTEKGKKYVDDTTDNSVILNERVFKEITGIKFLDKETKAIIDFTAIRKNITPFGEHRDYKDGDEVKYSIPFSLYDDGWRIEE